MTLTTRRGGYGTSSGAMVVVIAVVVKLYEDKSHLVKWTGWRKSRP
jgi:hypothetical protein